jgi:hypothetical protein
MNDDEVITIVTEQRDKVQSATPVEQVIGRGRRIRARRRIPGVAGALAVVAAAAVAVTTLLPSSHQPGHPAPARLAAWTVAHAGRRRHPCHHPRAAQPGRAAARPARRWRPG